MGVHVDIEKFKKYVPKKIDLRLVSIGMLATAMKVREDLMKSPEQRERELYESLKKKYENESKQ